MDNDRWRMGFHLTPPTGWLNDPNGLCQFKGIYHVFHQYSPDWPAQNAPRGWGHATSPDLIHWRHHGMAIAPDTPDEVSGSYSGCAVQIGAGSHARLRLFYTGNVKEAGDFDYVNNGRRATQILIETDDGFALGAKRVLMRPDDYPAFCTRHVRDPKVWRDGAGIWWMLLGARDVSDRGFALVSRSEDGIAWHYSHRIDADEPFGFMWECPDRIELGGQVALSVCPQGMQGYPWSNGIRDQAGYFDLPESCDLTAPITVHAGDFHRWDAGFDFYAPQSFVDAHGRTIMLGWMGIPDAPHDSAPNGLPWCHCLSVPRVLDRTAEGRITQTPVPELRALRTEPVDIRTSGTTMIEGRRADMELSAIDGPLSVVLDGALGISYEDGELALTFIGPAAQSVGAGRIRRSARIDTLDDLRILIDDSAVELFAGAGRLAMATRWFPTSDALTVSCKGSIGQARAWRMGDGMASIYEPSTTPGTLS